MSRTLRPRSYNKHTGFTLLDSTTYIYMGSGWCTAHTVAALTSCWDEVSIWDEEFVAIMFLQDIWEDLQGEALLLPGLLTPLVRVHFGVGQIRVVVFIF